MEIYKNLGGTSGIASFELGSNSIAVKFKDGVTYNYTYNSAGKSNVEEMKVLARQGSSLNAFIKKYVSKLYEVKIR